MQYLATRFPESRFGGFSDIDGTVVFYGRVNALIGSSTVLLDVGCGRGRASEDPVAYRRYLQKFAGKCARVIGIDISGAGSKNEQIDEFRLIESPRARWPVADTSVDVCLADNVLEHFEEPALFFSECHRVLRAGGYVCVRTPNAISYVGLATRLISNRYHAQILSRLQPGRKEEDIFPTFLSCNTRGQLRRMFSKYGFDHYVYGYDAEPSYLAFSHMAYTLGVLVRGVTPGAFRTTLFGFATKRSDVTD